MLPPETISSSRRSEMDKVLFFSTVFFFLSFSKNAHHVSMQMQSLPTGRWNFSPFFNVSDSSLLVKIVPSRGYMGLRDVTDFMFLVFFF